MIRLFSSTFIFLFTTTIFLNQIHNAQSENWQYKLIRDILKDYDNSIRPSIRHNATLNATFGLALTQILEVDEKNMMITTNSWLNQNWIDVKLKWNPSEYDGIEQVHIPIGKIWKPDILLVNNADELVEPSGSTYAVVKYNGNVTWLSTVMFKSSCAINVKYFPFDEQTCEMIFASWAYDGFLLDIHINSVEGDTSNYIKNGEWHLVKLKAERKVKRYSCCEEPYPEIIYELIIRRRPMYYAFNLVFPCLLITLVAFLGFFLPPGSGEKVGIGITSLLSITVFLMIVAEIMPPTTEIPLLSIYYALTIVIVSISTSFAVITLTINNRGSKGQKVPRILRVIFIDYLSKVLRTDLSNSESPAQSLIEKAAVEEGVEIKIQNCQDMKNKSKTYVPNKRDKPYKGSGRLEYIDTDQTISDSSESEPFNLCRNKNLTPLKLNPKYLKSNALVIKDSKSNRISNGNKNLYPIYQMECACECCETQYSYYDGKSSSISNGKIFKQKLNPKNYFMTPLASIESEFEDSTLSIDVGQHNVKKTNARSRHNSSDNKVEYSLSKESKLEMKALLENQFNPLIKILISSFESKGKIKLEEENMERIQNEWSDVAKVADHFLCYFFPLITVLTTLLVFLNSPHFFSQW